MQHSKSMPTSLSELVKGFESVWPVSGAEEWDRPGLTCGSPDQEVSRVLMCVDVTIDVLREAKTLSCDLVLSHHPLLLKGVNYLPEDKLKGELVAFAVRNSIALYSAHTNADIVVGGVSDVFATALGLKNIRPLVETASGVGHGRVGQLSEAITLRDFAQVVADCLPVTNAPLRVAGDLNQSLTKIAVVGGSGDSFISAAQQSGAQCLVTSDLRHHVSLDAVSDPSKPIALIDVSHFAAESLWLNPAATGLKSKFSSVEFFVSKLNTDPWSMSFSRGGHES